MTITYTDNSTYVFPSEVIDAANDEFSRLLAPAGKKIASF